MPEMEELLFQMAWREYDNLLWGIVNIESKASSIIVASGVLIAVILGLSSKTTSNFFVLPLLPFLLSIILASCAVFLKTSGVVYLKSPYQFFEKYYDISEHDIRTVMMNSVNEVHKFSGNAKKVGDSKLRFYNYSIFIFICGIALLIGLYISVLFFKGIIPALFVD